MINHLILSYLLQAKNETIRRNAMSIYKIMQKCQHIAQVGDDYKTVCLECGAVIKQNN